MLIATSFCDPSHSYAGHVPSWVAAIADHCDHVDVIALQTGGTPPPNVRYHSLGKEHGRSRFGRWLRFIALSAVLVPRSDAIFCMFSNSFVFGMWPFARLFRKPIVLWWAHGAVPWHLKIAEKLVARITTSSPHGCRLPSSKIHIVGQGISTIVFVSEPEHQRRPFTAISVGRLKPVKRFEDLITAAYILERREKLDFAIRIVGATEHGEPPAYQGALEQQISAHALQHRVTIEDDVPQREMPLRYQSADVMVNLGETGSMDKVVLEAMACGIPVLSANEAYTTLLSNVDRRLAIDKRDPAQLAERLYWLYSLSSAERHALGARLREIVVQDHSLTALGRKIVETTQQAQ